MKADRIVFHLIRKYVMLSYSTFLFFLKKGCFYRYSDLYFHFNCYYSIQSFGFFVDYRLTFVGQKREVVQKNPSLVTFLFWKFKFDEYFTRISRWRLPLLVTSSYRSILKIPFSGKPNLGHLIPCFQQVQYIQIQYSFHQRLPVKILALLPILWIIIVNKTLNVSNSIELFSIKHFIER